MNLSEFINIVDAQENLAETGYIINLPLKDGTWSKLFVDNCQSEYEAKERAFLYLSAVITNQQNKEG